jgi:PAS domain S-box-containing protein
MMPGMNGFQLLSELRSDKATSMIPVILLSARAGEEAESEGLEAGADDYLVKPFTARELMARVGAHISMYRLRLELMHKEQELRMKAEAAEQQYRAILESISEGFLFVDHNWRIEYANEQWAAISGLKFSETVGKVLWELFPELEGSPFGRGYRQAMENHENVRVEEYYKPLNRWFHTNIYPSSQGISIFAQDVTERRLHQDRLLLSEKLAATGRLAATIAHEINNPLESLLNLIYLARTSRECSARIREVLLTAEQELTRVSHIARHTLGFYRDTSAPSPIDMAALVEEVLTVYESRLRAVDIEVRKDFVALPPVEALRGEMHQVFSNLFSNAIDAMRDGGILTIVLREVEENDRLGIDVRIEDTGIGISPENLGRLFEAFFTTKPNAGTGLGLWVVKQFVESWGGRIEVTSSAEPDTHGTVFNLFVPLVAVSQSARKSATPPPVTE